MEEYDVIIIGAGIGGLICGCYLAKEGMKTLILEAHNKPGGCVTSIERHGAIFDMGAHLIGSCGRRGLFRKYMMDLNVDVEFIHLMPTDRFHFPDSVIEIPTDIENIISMLGNMFPKESRNIELFFKEMIRIATNFDSNDILDKYQDVSYQKMLDLYFCNSKLKSILSAQFFYIGVIPEKASALSMCLMVSSYLKDGCYYVKGSSQNLSNRLSERFMSLGGKLLLNESVEKIMLESGIAKKVVTQTGKEYRARYFVSNIDARKTMLELIDKSSMPVEYIKKIKRYVIGSSFFLVFLIIDIRQDELEKCSGWYHSSYDLNDISTESFYIFASTVYDKSLNKNGLQNMELAMPILHKDCVRNDWDSIKGKMEDDLINRANAVIPNLKQHIRYSFNATPKTIERFTGNSQGSLYGWEMDVNQVQRYRLDYGTPIKNLFLAGHWTKPGCGVVSVATSGWKVARHITKLVDMKASKI